MTTFQRTTSGLIAKYLFYDEPLVWVEGQTDIPFFIHILKNHKYRVEQAGGKPECEKLALAIIKYGHPYIVIFDGDYEILKRIRSPHRFIIKLHRHSMENYLFERDVIKQVCCGYAGNGNYDNEINTTYDNLINSINSELFELIILDIAHYFANTGNQVLPNVVDQILESNRSFVFSRKIIQDICTKFRKNEFQIDERETLYLLNNYLKSKRIIDIIQGHFVFSIIRNLIINLVRHKTGRNPNIDNNGLILLLSSEVWSLVPSSDHKNLRRRVLRAISNVKKIRQS